MGQSILILWYKDNVERFSITTKQFLSTRGACKHMGKHWTYFFNLNFNCRTFANRSSISQNSKHQLVGFHYSNAYSTSVARISQAKNLHNLNNFKPATMLKLLENTSESVKSCTSPPQPLIQTFCNSIVFICHLKLWLIEVR